jgi:hypothetical protein
MIKDRVKAKIKHAYSPHDVSNRNALAAGANNTTIIV